MDLEVDIDATLTMQATEDVCEVKQAGIFQLAEIKVGTITKNGKVFPVNKAGFNKKLHGLLKELSFVEGSVGSKPNFTKLFECDMHVESHVKHVSVFGK
jgi:hypothetical protein